MLGSKGKARPRKTQLARLVAVRGIGKRRAGEVGRTGENEETAMISVLAAIHDLLQRQDTIIRGDAFRNHPR